MKNLGRNIIYSFFVNSFPVEHHTVFQELSEAEKLGKFVMEEIWYHLRLLGKLVFTVVIVLHYSCSGC